MKVRLTDAGKKIVESLEIPESAKDAWNLTIHEAEIKSKEVRVLKVKVAEALEENKFYLAVILTGKILEIVDNKYIEHTLVVAQYADNVCYTEVVSVADARKKHKGFSVDVKKGIWKFNGEEFEIGRSRTCDDRCRYGVIGVYKCDSKEQLNIMVSAVNSAVEHNGGCLDD